MRCDFQKTDAARREKFGDSFKCSQCGVTVYGGPEDNPPSRRCKKSPPLDFPNAASFADIVCVNLGDPFEQAVGPGCGGCRKPIEGETATVTVSPCSAFGIDVQLDACRGCELDKTIRVDRPSSTRTSGRQATKRGGVVTVQETANGKPLPKGVGTICAELFHAQWGVEPCPLCMEIMYEMNERGPDWCEANIESLVDRIRDNARESNAWLVRIAAKAGPLFANVARATIREAITAAKSQ